MSSSGTFRARARSRRPRAATLRSIIATRPCAACSLHSATRSRGGCGRSLRWSRNVRHAPSRCRARARRSPRTRPVEVMKVAAFRQILAAAEGLYRDGGNEAAAQALSLLARLLTARDTMTVAAFAALLAKAPAEHDSGSGGGAGQAPVGELQRPP